MIFVNQEKTEDNPLSVQYNLKLKILMNSIHSQPPFARLGLALRSRAKLLRKIII